MIIQRIIIPYYCFFFFNQKPTSSVLKTVSPRFSSCNPFSSSTERYVSFWLKTHAPSFRVCSMHIHNITSSSAKAFLLISAERNARGCGRTSGPRFFACSRHVQRISNRELLRRREKSGPNERVPTLLTFDRFISALFFFCKNIYGCYIFIIQRCRFFQKPGANFNSTTIRQWARRPLNGQDVFLVNRAYYDFGGYLEYTIRSAFEAMQEGWNSQLVIDIYDP